MTRVKHGYDWGERSPRWAGVRSEVVDVRGTRVHLLRADADAAAPPDAPTHLLIHPMGAGSWSWLDVIRPLSAYGPVVAPDLPGSGRTRPKPSHRRAGRGEESARFLVDFMRGIGLERAVVHGHSMGGLVAVLFADIAPERVARLVLTAPPLPGRPDPLSRYNRTLLRFLLWIAPSLARIPLRAGLRWKAAAWRRWRENPRDTQLADALRRMGTDASRISPDLLAVIAEEIERYRVPWRLDGAIAAATSAVEALTIGQDAVREATDRVAAPTLLLWGDRDPVIPRALIDELVALHPTWAFQAFAGLGHVVPWEDPAGYVAVVGPWSVE